MLPEISLNILDIAQNSLRAGAGLIKISIEKNTKEHTFAFSVTDNGCGMSAEELERAKDPFYTSRTTRKVGLGIPFLIQAAEATGGRADIESAKGKGTAVKALFYTDHIDCMPAGDIVSTMIALICGLDGGSDMEGGAEGGQTDIVYTYSVDGNSYTLDTRQLREILGGVPFCEPEVRTFLYEYLTQNNQEADGGNI